VTKPPNKQHPATALVYMPRDVTFASEVSINAVIDAFQSAKLSAKVKAWSVGPRAIEPTQMTNQLRTAGIHVEDDASVKFVGTLRDLGLLNDAGELQEDPRRFP